jgi:membrane-associated phospholipid phosphatase
MKRKQLRWLSSFLLCLVGFPPLSMPQESVSSIREFSESASSIHEFSESAPSVRETSEPSPPADDARIGSETEDLTASPIPERPYGFHQIGLDAKYLVTRPAHLDRNGILKLAMTFGTAGVLYVYREEIRDWVQSHRDPQRDEFLDSARVMGKGATAPALALIAYGSSFITKNPREKETSVLLLESVGFSSVAVGVEQWVLASERPREGTDTDLFGRRGHGASGDAMLAASIVPILSRQYLTPGAEDGGGERFAKLSAASLLYAGAFLTGYQRMNTDAHWAPDVFLGLVTGFSIGQMLCDSHEASRAETARRFHFSAGPGTFQATLRF